MLNVDWNKVNYRKKRDFELNYIIRCNLKPNDAFMSKWSTSICSFNFWVKSFDSSSNLMKEKKFTSLFKLHSVKIFT